MSAVLTPTWDRWKRPENDGRAAVELRERCLWQSALNMRRPPDLTDINELARAVRRGTTE